MLRIDVAAWSDVSELFLYPAVCAERSFGREIPGAGSATKKEAKKAGTSYP